VIITKEKNFFFYYEKGFDIGFDDNALFRGGGGGAEREGDG
jgi:hypothetical protein